MSQESGTPRGIHGAIAAVLVATFAGSLAALSLIHI